MFTGKILKHDTDLFLRRDSNMLPHRDTIHLIQDNP